MTTKSRILHTFILLAALVATSGTLTAQQPGAPPPPPQQASRPPHRPGPGGENLLPPGTWWTNPDVIARIALTPDQRKRIEDIFLTSRLQLTQMHATLEQQQLMLEPLLEANPLDQGKALAQIGQIADSRAALEKANAKMLLSIRSVLTADQWTKLRSGPREDRGDRPGRAPHADRGTDRGAGRNPDRNPGRNPDRNPDQPSAPGSPDRLLPTKLANSETLLTRRE